MHDFSKPIQKVDDASKQFIIECLKGQKTHGFDVDSIYYHQGQWYLFEYLKCESEVVTPYSSHPKYYPCNWRKFYCLYVLSRQLGGRLFLINYSTRETDRDQVKRMEVLDFHTELIRAYENGEISRPVEYMDLVETRMTLAEYQHWLKEINQDAGLPPFRWR